MDVLPRQSDRPSPRTVPNPTPGVLLAAGALVVTIVVGADRWGSGRSIAAEWVPDFGPWYLLRSAGLAIASVALLVGLRRLALAAFGARTGTEVGRYEIAVAVLGAIPAVGSAVLVVVDPARLSTLVREDGLVEWGSAGLAFVAAALYGLAALGRDRPGTPRLHPATRAVLLLASAACLLLGLEEISWFQRVFEVESPEFMVNRNGQQELNLHNLATGATGNAYFVGAFLFGVAAPFVLADRRLPARLSWLEPVVPSRSVLFATATSAAVVYEMWNIVWIQMAFWLTLVALAGLGDGRSSRRLGRVLLVVAVLVAAAHLGFGEEMIRSWDDTEVRELIIPFGLVVAGFEAVLRSRPADDGSG